MGERECPECATKIEDGLSCPKCGHNLASDIVSRRSTGNRTDHDSNTSEDSQRSPSDVVENAPGNIAEGSLTDVSGFAGTYLYTQPLIKYLHTDETLAYLLRNFDDPLSVTDRGTPTGTSVPEFPPADGRHYLLVTDTRLLYVAGHEDGDSTHEVQYNELAEVESQSDLTQERLVFVDTDGTQYEFATSSDAGEVEDAVEYIRERAPGLERNQEPDWADHSFELLEYEPPIERLSPRAITAVLTLLVVPTVVGITWTAALSTSVVGEGFATLTLYLLGVAFVYFGGLTKELVYVLLFLPIIVVGGIWLILNLLLLIASVGMALAGESLLRNVLVVIGGLIAGSAVVSLSWYGVTIGGTLLKSLLDAAVRVVLPAGAIGIGSYLVLLGTGVLSALAVPVAVVATLASLPVTYRFSHVTDVLITATIGAIVLSGLAAAQQFLETTTMAFQNLSRPFAGDPLAVDAGQYLGVVATSVGTVAAVVTPFIIESAALFVCLLISGTVVQYTWVYHPMWVIRYLNDISRRLSFLQPYRNTDWVKSITDSYIKFAAKVGVHHQDDHPLRGDLPSLKEFYNVEEN